MASVDVLLAVLFLSVSIIVGGMVRSGGLGVFGRWNPGRAMSRACAVHLAHTHDARLRKRSLAATSNQFELTGDGRRFSRSVV